MIPIHAAIPHGQVHSLSLDSQPVQVRRHDLTPRIVDDSVLILDRTQGQLHQLNATAGFIWNCCDGAQTIRHIAVQLGDAFQVDSTTAERDVLLTLQQFCDLGLVTVNTAASA